MEDKDNNRIGLYDIVNNNKLIFLKASLFGLSLGLITLGAYKYTTTSSVKNEDDSMYKFQ